MIHAAEMAFRKRNYGLCRPAAALVKAHPLWTRPSQDDQFGTVRGGEVSLRGRVRRKKRR
jgi:hypothetical protein